MQKVVCFKPIHFLLNRSKVLEIRLEGGPEQCFKTEQKCKLQEAPQPSAYSIGSQSCQPQTGASLGASPAPPGLNPGALGLKGILPEVEFLMAWDGGAV